VNPETGIWKRERLLEIFQTLLEALGPRGWWPADSPFEVIVGAILTQNTAWKNVEKAIQNLKARNLLSPEAIEASSKEELAQWIRPAGYFNQKAQRLKDFVHFLMKEYEGDLEKMARAPLDKLRKQLLSIRGIGPETADSILLYALNKPSFVVDAYTFRIFARHGWWNDPPRYEEMRRAFLDHLPEDVDLFNEFHALLDYVGHHFCRKQPNCEECPLRKYGTPEP